MDTKMMKPATADVIIRLPDASAKQSTATGLILIGPPGAGKGTQARPLSQRLGRPHVATGDLLRSEIEAQSDVGLRAAALMKDGRLVPDATVLEIVRRRLSREDTRSGFVLDGFPRTEAQAIALDDVLADIGQSVGAVILIEVPDDVIIGRLSARAICAACGRTYSIEPGSTGWCADDGTVLSRRDDDHSDAIRRRLAVYRRDTAPVVALYEARGLLHRLDGTQNVDSVTERVAVAVSGAGAIRS